MNHFEKVLIKHSRKSSKCLPHFLDESYQLHAAHLAALSVETCLAIFGVLTPFGVVGFVVAFLVD